MLPRSATVQPTSAQKRVVELGIEHGDKAVVDVVVGVTPATATSPQTAHFCSSRMRLHELLARGDGKPVPVDANYEVTLGNGLWRVAKPSLVLFRALVVPNGRLNFHACEDVVAKAVEIPAHLVGQCPWAFEGGSEQVARSYGHKDLKELFDHQGQLLTV